MMLAISVTQTASKEVLFVFCMKYPTKAIVRLAHSSFRGQRFNLYSAHWGLQHRSFSSPLSDYSEDPAMVKDKVQFQLKTPKGTKDCRYFIYLWLNRN